MTHLCKPYHKCGVVTKDSFEFQKPQKIQVGGLPVSRLSRPQSPHQPPRQPRGATQVRGEQRLEGGARSNKPKTLSEILQSRDRKTNAYVRMNNYSHCYCYV